MSAIDAVSLHVQGRSASLIRVFDENENAFLVRKQFVEQLLWPIHIKLSQLNTALKRLHIVEVEKAKALEMAFLRDACLIEPRGSCVAMIRATHAQLVMEDLKMDPQDIKAFHATCVVAPRCGACL